MGAATPVMSNQDFEDGKREHLMSLTVEELVILSSDDIEQWFAVNKVAKPTHGSLISAAKRYLFLESPKKAVSKAPLSRPKTRKQTRRSFLHQEEEEHRSFVQEEEQFRDEELSIISDLSFFDVDYSSGDEEDQRRESFEFCLSIASLQF